MNEKKAAFICIHNTCLDFDPYREKVIEEIERKIKGMMKSL